jgi:hypothetical protein
MNSKEGLLKLAGELSIPRTFGSPQEGKTRHLVAGALEKAGWLVEQKPFSALFTIDTLLPAGISAIAFFILLSTAALPNRPWLSAFSGLAALGLLTFLDRWALSLLRQGIRMTPKDASPIQGTNLIASHPELATSKKTLWLAAHLDSKGQMLPLLVRSILTVTARASCTVAALASLAYLLSAHGLILTIQRTAFVLASLTSLPLLVNTSERQSPGALDNAGSLALLVEIARKLGEDPRRIGDLQVKLVATSGEEAGCLGALALSLKENQKEERPMVLNLEALGAGQRLIIIGSPKAGWKGAGDSPLTDAILSATREQGVSYLRLPIAPGFWADHLAFLRAGFEAVTLASLGSGLWTIHTEADKVENIDGEALMNQCQFVLDVLTRLGTEKGLAQKHNIL